MQVACPHCNQVLDVPDALAGQVARCGACATLFTVPGVAGAPPAVPPPGPPPQQAPGPPTPESGTFGDVPGPAAAGPPAPPPQYQFSYTRPSAAADPRVRMHCGVIGGLMIALGVLTIGWGVLWLLAIQSPEELFKQQPHLSSSDQEGALIVLGLAAAMSLATGLFEILAGVLLAAKRIRARGIGIAAAIVAVISLWTCCLWVCGLGVGIYALVILVPNKAA